MEPLLKTERPPAVLEHGDAVSARRRDLVLVTAGLELDGGGRAAAGRLLAAATAAYAVERGLGFRALALHGPEGAPPGVAVRGFAGNRAALAAAVLGRQLARERSAYLFDLLGLARVQALVPGPWRAPYLVALYGIEVWRPLGWDRSRALANAAALFAISRHTVERARPFWPARGAGSGEAEVVPLALEERPAAGDPDRELLARAGDGFLLIAGRMAAGERYKGHDALLDAMTRLRAGHPGARLVVAGDGDDRPRLEARAAALGLGGVVLFAGFVSEATLGELYRRAAVFVMPSTGEGFGLVYLEAMRAGRACVAARGSAAEEIVVDGATGLLVDPADPTDLAAGLARLLGDPALARRLGEAGRRRWQREFGAERFRERLEPLLDRLAGMG